MAKLIPCRHLDYDEDSYPQCVIETCEPHFPHVRYWRRLNVPYEGAAEKVQFCGEGRGRINQIFGCYNGEMHCYQPLNASKGEE